MVVNGVYHKSNFFIIFNFQQKLEEVDENEKPVEAEPVSAEPVETETNIIEPVKDDETVEESIEIVKTSDSSGIFISGKKVHTELLKNYFIEIKFAFCFLIKYFSSS